MESSLCRASDNESAWESGKKSGCLVGRSERECGKEKSTPSRVAHVVMQSLCENIHTPVVCMFLREEVHQGMVY